MYKSEQKIQFNQVGTLYRSTIKLPKIYRRKSIERFPEKSMLIVKYLYLTSLNFTVTK